LLSFLYPVDKSLSPSLACKLPSIPVIPYTKVLL
jgi:hypothetical protein